VPWLRLLLIRYDLGVIPYTASCPCFPVIYAWDTVDVVEYRKMVKEEGRAEEWAKLADKYAKTRTRREG